MLTCISCTKQVNEDEKGDQEGARGTPRTKEAFKSLTAQIKDIAVKFSGACSKPSSSPNSPYKKGLKTASRVPYSYRTPGSSSSSPPWDFTGIGNLRGLSSDLRATGALNGPRKTPEGQEVMAAQARDVAVASKDEPKEWMAQVEPGVHITFASLSNGGNDLRRIRFSREMFNKGEAQRWWGENYDRIMELYNVQRFNRHDLDTPSRSEDERDSSCSRMESARESNMTQSSNKEWIPQPHYNPSSQNKAHFLPEPSNQGNNNGGSRAYTSTSGLKGDPSAMDASRTTTSSRDEASVSISNASEMDSEWIEQDEPGVYITIRQLADGTRELRRIRFSREKFGEINAKLWWEENKERIQAQYL